MPYSTQAELVTAVGEHVVRDLYDLDEDADLGVEVPAITANLAEGSSVCDSYLSAYLPIAEASPALRRANISISLYLQGVARENASEQRKEAYDVAIAWLRDVSKGLASLGLPEDAITDPGSPEVYAEDRLWTRSTMRGLL